jgi:transposase-like protein
MVPPDGKLRRVKYLNNVIEQDHRFVKKEVVVQFEILSQYLCGSHLQTEPLLS